MDYEMYYINKIKMLIRRFGLDLRLKTYEETSAKIKIKMTTRGKIQSILKLENEFQNLFGNVRLISNKGFINLIIPKTNPNDYMLSDMLNSHFYKSADATIKIPLGENLNGSMAVGDLTKWVNVLIGGEPGSGKSVFLHNIINSLITTYQPSFIRLVLIDLKRVEFTRYNYIAHLEKDVVVDENKADDTLLALISEMNRRYEKLSDENCNNIQKYHSKGFKMPYLVIVIDELANLILSAKHVEKQIVKLAQMGRACGMHLILSTQKPSAEVVTSLIKANVPTRIAFSVASHYDSSTILDSVGAEKLSKRGDMIVKDEDGQEQIQCAFMTDDEIERNIIQYKEMKFEEEDVIVECNYKRLDFIEAEFEEVKVSEYDRLYQMAVDYVEDHGECNQWQLRQHLHKGIEFVDRIIDNLMKDEIIIDFKIGNVYKKWGYENVN